MSPLGRIYLWDGQRAQSELFARLVQSFLDLPELGGRPCSQPGRNFDVTWLPILFGSFQEGHDEKKMSNHEVALDGKSEGGYCSRDRALRPMRRHHDTGYPKCFERGRGFCSTNGHAEHRLCRSHS